MLSPSRTRPDPPLRRRRSFRPRLEPLEIRLTPTATQLTILSQPPASIAAGQDFGLTIAAEDASGNVDTTAIGSVVVGLLNNDGGGVLGGLTSATLLEGVASFSGLTLNRAGVGYTLVVAGGGLPSVDTSPFEVTAAAASQLAETMSPQAKVPAGQAFGLTVTVEDQYGNTVENFAGNLAVATTNGSLEGPLGGTLTVATTNGVATFTDLSLIKSGTPFTLQVSATGLPALTTSPFSVMADPATQLAVISAPPGTAAAGVGFGVVLAAEDPYGNVDSTFAGSATLTLPGDPTGDTLLGNTTERFSGGVVTFAGLTLIRPGSGYGLAASAVSAATGSMLDPPAPSALAFSVTAGPATQLVQTSTPLTSVTAGVPFGLVLAAEDQFGNVAPTFNGNVTLAIASNPGGDVLGGATNATFSNGLASFSGLTLDVVGKGYTLVAASNGLAPSTTLAFDVNAVATQLVVVSPPPADITAGAGFGLVLAAEDPFGNVDPSFAGNVTLTLPGDPTGDTLLGNTTERFSGGVVTFAGLTLIRPGSDYVLAASAVSAATGSMLDPPAPSALAFSVTAGPAVQLVQTSTPLTSVTAGVPFGLVLAAEDQFGNVAPTFNGNVTLAIASNPGGDVLGGATNATFSNGLASFSGLTLDVVGKGYTLVAASNGLAPSTTLAFDVNAVATQLVVVSPPPADITAGAGFGLVLAAEDPFGNVDPSFAGNVTLTLPGDPTGDTLLGNTTERFSGGVVTFAGLTLIRPGSDYVLAASAVSAATGSMLDPPAPSALAFSVTAGPAVQLVQTSTPLTSVTAGVPFGLVLAAEDQFGNVAPTFNGNVTLAIASNPGGDVLGGATNATFSNGLASFSGLTLDAVGKGYTLVAASNGLAPSTTLAFDVNAVATQLVVVSPPPADITAGAGFGLVLAAEDPFGNVDPSFAGNVTVALGHNPGGATLGGSTNVSFSNGLASFTGLTLGEPGTGYTLLASSSGLIPSASLASLTLNATTPPAPTRLEIISPPPADITAGQAFGLSVAVEDASGNVDTTFSGGVVVGLASNTTGGILGGVTSTLLSNGVASFSGLTLDQAGSGYTIQAASGGLDPSIALPFIVTPAAASQIVVTSPPPPVVAAGAPFGLSVAVEDQYGNAVGGFSGNVAVATTNPATEGNLGGIPTVRVVGGGAAFVGLSLADPGSSFTLQVSGPGLPTITTSPFSVTSPAIATTTGDGTTTTGDGTTTTGDGTTTTGDGALTSTPTGGSSSGASTATGGTSGAVPYLVIAGQPTLVDAGRYFELTVDLETAQGAIDLSYTGEVSLELAGGSGVATLGGTLNMPVQNGLLTFYGLTLSAAGSGFTIRASAPGYASAVTAPIAAENPPALLAIAGPTPAMIGPGRTFGLTIVVEDATGNRVHGYEGSVTLTLIGHRGGASLRGNRTVAAVDGVATFAGLSLKGTRKRAVVEVQADAGGLSDATTSLSAARPATVPHRPRVGKVVRMREAVKRSGV